MNNIKLLKSRWYLPVKILFILGIAMSFTVLIAMSWNDFYDNAAAAGGITWENCTNKLWYYVFVKGDGTWLPVTMATLIALFASLFMWLTPRKPSFDYMKKEATLLELVNEMTNYHQQLLTEVISIVQRDAQEKKVQKLNSEESVRAWMNTLRTHMIKTMMLSHKALNEEQRKELERNITQLIDTETQKQIEYAKKQKELEERQKNAIDLKSIETEAPKTVSVPIQEHRPNVPIVARFD